MRIVSLLPSATEMVCALGLREQLVGVTHECDYPSDVVTLPKLTRSTLELRLDAGETTAAAIDRAVKESAHNGMALYAVDEEQLRALEPDLVITQMLCSVCAVSGEYVEDAIAKLPNRPQLLSMEPRSLDDVFADIRRLAEVTNRVAEAEAFISTLIDRKDALKQKTARLEPRRTLLLEWTDPPYSAGHWTPSLIELAGGVPVCAFPGAYSQVIRWEDAIAADPEVIIVVPCGFGLPATEEAMTQLAATCDAWNTLSANRRVVLLDGNQFANRPGPRLIDTAEHFAAAIHPHAFPQSDSEYMRVWST